MQQAQIKGIFGLLIKNKITEDLHQKYVNEFSFPEEILDSVKICLLTQFYNNMQKEKKTARFLQAQGLKV